MSNMSETFSPTSYYLMNAVDPRILPIENFSIDEILNSSMSFRYEVAGHVINDFQISFSAIYVNSADQSTSVTGAASANGNVSLYVPDGNVDAGFTKYFVEVASPGTTAHTIELYFVRSGGQAGSDEYIDVFVWFDEELNSASQSGYVISAPVMTTNVSAEEQPDEPELEEETDKPLGWDSLSIDARSYLAKNTYFSSEIASEIRKLKDYIGGSGTGSAGLSKLDSVHFGGYELDVLSQLFTNPGLTDPKYYEEIAESIDTVTEDFAETICGEWTIIGQDGGE